MINQNLYLSNFYNKGPATELEYFSKTMAVVLTQARVNIYRHLNNLYIRGPFDILGYGPKSFIGDMPFKFPWAYKADLDKLGWMFRVYRRFGEEDEPYRQRIIYSIKASTTKSGLKATLKFIFEQSPIVFQYAGFDVQFDVEIRETWNDFADFVSSGFNAPLRGKDTRLFGVTLYLKPKPFEFTLARNIDYRSIVEYSGFSGFRELLRNIVAAGIKVERVIFVQWGAGGNKGEFYAYEV